MVKIGDGEYRLNPFFVRSSFQREKTQKVKFKQKVLIPSSSGLHFRGGKLC